MQIKFTRVVNCQSNCQWLDIIIAYQYAVLHNIYYLHYLFEARIARAQLMWAAFGGLGADVGGR